MAKTLALSDKSGLLSKYGTRESNLELFRILCMFWITAHHYIYYGGFSVPDDITLNKFFAMIFDIGGQIGVSGFVLVSGYFMVTTEFRGKKLIRLVLDVLIYTLLFLMIFYMRDPNVMGEAKITEFIFPFANSKYWFMTHYVVLYIISPFLNAAIRNLKQKTYFGLLIAGFVIWCLLPNFENLSPTYSKLIWFIYLYCLAGYIRLYPNKITEAKGHGAVAALACVFSAFMVILLKGHEFTEYNPLFFVTENKVLTLLCILPLFLAFKNIKIGKNRIINFISSSMLAVYIITDNQFLRYYIWRYEFNLFNFLDKWYFPLHVIMFIVVIMLSCVLVDKVIGFVLDHSIYLLLGKPYDWCAGKMSIFTDRLISGLSIKEKVKTNKKHHKK